MNKHCNCDETCTCGCQEGKPCTCGCSDNTDKEIACELCRTLISGRTFNADHVAESFKIIYEAVKSCK